MGDCREAPGFGGIRGEQVGGGRREGEGDLTHVQKERKQEYVHVDPHTLKHRALY